LTIISAIFNFFHIIRRKNGITGGMSMNSIEYHPIGIIHTPFKTPDGTPIQPIGAKDSQGEIVLSPDFAAGLADLAGFSHIILLYHFHLSKKFSLKVKPFLDDAAHGLFSTRAPSRPNPIGFSVVRLIEINGHRLNITGADVVDGTPLLDIKPYVPAFDAHAADSIGWLAKKSTSAGKTVADKRFAKKE
jgi:tRNA (adenine37-N6)-methyltransferase